MISNLLIPLYLLISLSNSDHGIYVSIIEIDHQQMNVKVFTDNLQDAIRNDSKSFVPTDEKTFLDANKEAIEAYFQKKIRVKTHGAEIGFSLAEATWKGDIYWITLSMEVEEKGQLVQLHASYLMELFPDQINVVKVIGEKPQLFRLSKSHPTCEFSL